MGLFEDILLMGANLSFMVYLIVGIIIASALVGWWYFKIRPYPIRVNLWTHYNNAIVEINGGGKAGIVTKDNKKFFTLSRDPAVLLDSSVFSDVSYGEVLSLFMISPGKYIPLKVVLQKMTTEGVTEVEAKFIASLDEQAYAYAFADSVKYNQDRFKYESLLMQYMPIITIVLLCVMILIISFVIGGKAVEAFQEEHKAAEANLAASTNFKEGAQYLYAIALNRSIINLPATPPPK